MRFIQLLDHGDNLLYEQSSLLHFSMYLQDCYLVVLNISMNMSQPSYKKWLFEIAFFSFVVSSFGVNFILEFSVPILSVICPITTVVVIIGLIISYKEK